MNREVVLQPFEIEDLEKMEVDEDINYDGFRDILYASLKLGDAATIHYKGDILGAMGYYEMWKGVCEVWLFVAKNIQHKGVLGLTFETALEQLCESGKYHRIQGTARINQINEHFFPKLNFTCEGVLKQYSINKHDYKMWARVI